MYMHNETVITEAQARQIIERTLPDYPNPTDLSREISRLMGNLRQYHSLFLGSNDYLTWQPDPPNPRTVFYAENMDAIVRVATGILRSPLLKPLPHSPAGAQLNRQHIIDEAAAIVSEICRRTGRPHLNDEESTPDVC